MAGQELYYVKSISIHALLAESDPFSRCGRMTRRYFYPRSPCGERPAHCFDGGEASGISIHALLAESDCRDRKAHVGNSLFLSTLSLRRATSSPLMWPWSPLFLSTLSLRRATPRLARVVPTPIFLSTLSLRRATQPLKTSTAPKKFLSTLSLRRATPRSLKMALAQSISIHALLAESDLSAWRKSARLSLISIHALLAESDPLDEFQDLAPDISIHALLAESDRPKRYPAPACMYFYPRSPCGERRKRFCRGAFPY